LTAEAIVLLQASFSTHLSATCTLRTKTTGMLRTKRLLLSTVNRRDFSSMLLFAVFVFVIGWRRGSVFRTSVSGWRTFRDLRLIYG